MAKEQPSYVWAKQELAKDCETIDCRVYDEINDFKRDPTGFYVLIKTNFDIGRIEVAICDKDHKIVKIFRGKRTQDVYDAIFTYEKKYKLHWFQEKDHIAYLGKELKKAELALAMGQNAYYQD